MMKMTMMMSEIGLAYIHVDRGRARTRNAFFGRPTMFIRSDLSHAACSATGFLFMVPSILPSFARGWGK